MSAIDRVASALSRRDEAPNQELARQLAEDEDCEGIAEVARGLSHKDRAIQADCVKVLYEIGYLKPDLIAPYAADCLKLLKSRNNRLVWGGMIALATVGTICADELFPHARLVQQTMNTGSVITRDAGIWALAGIASASQAYNAAIFPYLLDHLRTCRPKEVPQHAERIVGAVRAENKDDFIQTIEKRMVDMSATQIKRLRRVISQAKRE